MKRRNFLHIMSLAAPGLLVGCSSLSKFCLHCHSSTRNENIDSDLAETQTILTQEVGPVAALHQHDQRARSDYFHQNFPDDIYLEGERFDLLVSLVRKIDQIQSYVGHGNFNILSWNEMLHYAHYAPGIEAFSSLEIKFLEELFYFDATLYGFMGAKVFTEIDSEISRRDIYKVPHSGHFLKKGASLEAYQKLRDDVGESLILTSGLRAQVKQFYLFMEKARESKGNLSMASRSLAPPGYSFHGRGDFDVGKLGHGRLNFTERFADTEVYQKLIALGYIDIRYTQGNLLGVRFEPWHIKVEDA